jgi:hypothetical protein
LAGGCYRLEGEKGVDLGAIADIVAEGAGGGDMDEDFGGLCMWMGRGHFILLSR